MKWTRLCHGRSRVIRCPADFDVGSDRGQRSGWCDDSTFQIININSFRPPHRQGLRARKFTVANDCGLLINPDGLRRCIEGNVVQGTSRTLSEEVAFDRAKVTSVDWTTCPILDITEAPETVDIVLINSPELPPAGAGETSIRPAAAAIAYAVFNATGVRLRRAPLTPQRLKPALA